MGMKLARPITDDLLATIADRFWSKAELDPQTGCLIWRGSRDGRGYGKISALRLWWRAPRIAHSLAKAIPQPDELVRHKCDNHSCINPDHLELGDALLNARDRMERGREPDRRGEGNGRCKLSPADVRAIRTCGLSSRVMAKIYGVAPATIRDARSGRQWSHLK